MPAGLCCCDKGGARPEMAALSQSSALSPIGTPKGVEKCAEKALKSRKIARRRF